MKQNRNAFVVLRSRILSLIGITAAGAGMVTLASSGQVFASQFLKDGIPPANPAMVYSPKLQMMVKPGTEDPVFRYSRVLLGGKANGEYRVAPLINCPMDPSCPTPPPPPPPPSHTVTPNDDPNGAGPTGDTD